MRKNTILTVLRCFYVIITAGGRATVTNIGFVFISMLKKNIKLLCVDWSVSLWVLVFRPVHQWVYIAGPSYSRLQCQLSAHYFPREELSSLHCNRIPGSVTWSCVPEEHTKYHPMGDDIAPASASSDQDSVLKWSKCSFLSWWIYWSLVKEKG